MLSSTSARLLAELPSPMSAISDKDEGCRFQPSWFVVMSIGRSHNAHQCTMVFQSFSMVAYSPRDRMTDLKKIKKDLVFNTQVIMSQLI